MRKIKRISKKKDANIRDFGKEAWEAINYIHEEGKSERILLIVANLDARSIEQNRFYFLIVNLIAEAYGMTSDATHTALKCMLLEVNEGVTTNKATIEDKDYETWGELPSRVEDLPESKSLSKKEFPIYWQRCAVFGNAKFDLRIPLEPKKMNDEEYEYFLTETI